MTINEFKEEAAILLMMESPINLVLVGPPGVGKSQAVEQIGDDLGFEILIIHAVTSDPTDMKGLPVTWTDKDGNKNAEWIPFGDLLKIVTAVEPLLVFFDDFGQAPASVQAAVMQLIEARQLNGYKVSDKVRFIFATNRREDAAGVKSILSTIKSRCLLLEIEPSVDEFRRFISGDKKCHPIVPFYVDWLQTDGTASKLGELFDYAPSKDMSNTCLPRTLHRAGRVLMAYEEKGKIPRPEVIYGLIGKGRGSELMGFLSIWKEIPDPKEFLKAPSKDKIPTKPSVLFAFMAKVTSMANHHNADAVMEFIEMLPAELGMMMIKTFRSMSETQNKGIIDPKKWSHHPVCVTKKFQEFMVKHQGVLLYGL
jgi:hypothetical protein